MTNETFRQYEEALASLFRQIGTTDYNEYYISLRVLGVHGHDDAVRACKTKQESDASGRKPVVSFERSTPRTCDEDFQHP